MILQSPSLMDILLKYDRQRIGENSSSMTPTLTILE